MPPNNTPRGTKLCKCKRAHQRERTRGLGVGGERIRGCTHAMPSRQRPFPYVCTCHWLTQSHMETLRSVCRACPAESSFEDTVLGMPWHTSHVQRAAKIWHPCPAVTYKVVGACRSRCMRLTRHFHSTEPDLSWTHSHCNIARNTLIANALCCWLQVHHELLGQQVWCPHS